MQKVIFWQRHLGDQSRHTFWHRHLRINVYFSLRLLNLLLIYDIWLFYWFLFRRLLLAFWRLFVNVVCFTLFFFLRSHNLIPIIIRLTFCEYRGRFCKFNFFYFFCLFKRRFWFLWDSDFLKNLVDIDRLSDLRFLFWNRRDNLRFWFYRLLLNVSLNYWICFPNRLGLNFYSRITFRRNFLKFRKRHLNCFRFFLTKNLFFLSHFFLNY